MGITGVFLAKNTGDLTNGFIYDILVCSQSGNRRAVGRVAAASPREKDGKEGGLDK